MKKQRIAVTLIAGAVIALFDGAAFGQTSAELQKALADAREAAAQAQAAAASAQAALEKVQAQASAAAADAAAAKAQAQAAMTPAVVPPVTPAAMGGLYFQGNIDVGYRSTRDSDHTKNVNQVTTSNASTSLVLFRGYRKLPSDMTAFFNLELDLNPSQSSTATQGAGGQAFNGTPFQGEQYAALSGNWGLVQVGEPNAHMYVVTNAAQPFATALGSAISPTFGRLGTNNIAGITNSDDVAPARIIRHEKDIKYTTPGFAGFKGVFEYSAKNGNSTADTANSNQYLEAGGQYNNGPLNVYYSWTKETAGVHGAAAPTTAIGTNPPVGLPADTSIVFNGLSANYTFGDATIYGGITTTKHDAPVPLEKSKSYNIAGKYNITPQIDVAFNLLRRDSDIANQPDTNFLGLGSDYFFDKQTSVYLRGEYWKNDSTPVSPTVRHGSAAAGIRYVF